ncbi:OLC1v1007246C1 [Oldenlandia corymbosa var. corymbosa]|uniref:OLC1v1007246C1 n=1 Tax=Oldenlandia corymbosa var. corymbosa TaxID=529605 RepID=A0AAV1DIV2_OLDCO|nr:OLC1v1007246C1 [Oldenlandia corymbosa var. corymbosa]
MEIPKKEVLENYENGYGHSSMNGTLKTPIQPKIENSESSFNFVELGCIRTRNKVICCDFSSDGKFLASAGHDKKTVIWNMETLQTDTTPEENQYVITDVRFRPNSTQFATASFDKSIRLWDAAKPGHCLHAYTAHPSQILSLDFHPKKNDVFCFSDASDEVRYWDINPLSCARLSKQAGSAHVRFQPITGKLLAAASDEMVTVYDVENDRESHSFQGHSGLINYLSWDHNGDYLASVSEDSARVWSLASGECIHELRSNGDRFHSCLFHPNHSGLLVIGGERNLALWNMVEHKRITLAAHERIIAAVANSAVTGMIASASHDFSVKLWK